MSDDNNSGLTRRRVLGGIATVGAASAAAGAGTMAYFSDTEESTGNEVQAGTLNLKVNGGDDIDGASTSFGPVAPGWSHTQSITLENAGTITGRLYLALDVTGDLEDDLDVTLDGHGPYDLSQVDTDGNWYDTGIDLDGGDSVSGDVTLELPTSVGNEAQGEQATLDVSMGLVQNNDDGTGDETDL